MNRRWAIVLLGLAALVLAYRGWRAARSRPPATSGPDLTLEAPDKYALGPGAEAVVWGFKGQGVRELIARLLVARDGRQLPGSKTVCRWEGGSASPPTEGRLTYLLQDVDPFGAKGRRLPSLGVHFCQAGPTLTF